MNLDHLNDSLKLVYILGGGHSGSTILTLMLGSAPDVFAMGELKFYNEHKILDLPRWGYMGNTCTCGRHALECPFWLRVAPHVESHPTIFHYTTAKQKLVALIKLLSPWYHSGLSHQNTVDAADDYYLMQSVFEEAKQEKPEVVHLLDSSKSLMRLMHVRTHPKIDLRVIFLVRDGRGYIHSYRKRHGGGFGRWLIQWVIVNSLSLIYLRRTKLPYYYLTYTSLCQKPEENIRQMNAFLGVNIPENFPAGLSGGDFHIRASNPHRLRELKELRENLEWRTALHPIYRWLSSFLLYPFTRFFLDPSKVRRFIGK